MTLPNFFILGAPKCGTTSMAAWLSSHPRVCFSATKEPNYFSYDFSERSVSTLADYQRQFRVAQPAHTVVAEASVNYLYSRTAVPAILAYADQPRFLVMTRDPVDMAYSLHDQAVFNGDEDVADFATAWGLQRIRSYGARLPRGCADPQVLQYARICALGEQVERLYSQVPRQQVLVLRLEDIKVDPRRQYLRVLAFLGIPDDGRINFPVENPAKMRAHPRVWAAIRAMNRGLRALGVPHIRLGLTRLVGEQDRKPRPRPPLSPELAAELRRHFRPDVERLEALTGWDLRAWKAVTGA